MDERPRFRQANRRDDPPRTEMARPKVPPSVWDDDPPPALPVADVPRRDMARQPSPPLAPIAQRSQPPLRTFRPLLHRSDGRWWLAPFPVGASVALVGSAIFIVTGIINRDANQIPILCAGLAVFGLTLAAVAVVCVITVVRSARVGRDGRAFVAALGGGAAALGAAGALSAAYIMALLWGSAHP